ncbi:MAG: Co2+/Mg2+ efflux protein ApaG [Sandaracinaceae bacterium]|jgi:ApaG protein|nr:Co2+/Mg2+ efflux protein ApaG [Sandaracinaceae bacterium]MBK7153833.1 Co2+/Mg2+ efflux protein ApaG [Sandaracinaceae bacterium]MBK8408202.1 Co2+/Mg2+ efflux protein ApaG [Sandaracinaceae bacterium]MBK8591029.1 Co2+/Mg2+ efflux protein ApaG [Sandaracinaceae bacterium]
MSIKTKSHAETRGVRVLVESRFLEEQSQPAAERFAFAYRVRIENVGSEVVQLRTRHWVITDSYKHVEEVRGPGVIGEQPTLRPGQAFEYTSGAILRTQRGSMKGSYQMVTEGGEQFDAVIAEFALERPYSLN